MSIVAVHGPHTWGQPFFAESDNIIVNLLGPLDLEFKSKVRQDVAPGAAPYEWGFGDGTTVIDGFEVRHVFAEPGTFTITMTVNTKRGPVTDQIEINLGGNGHQAEVTELEVAKEKRKVA